MATSATRPWPEVGIIDYPGAQRGALYGMSDLFWVANLHAAGHGVDGVRATIWAMNADGQIKRREDSRPQDGDTIPAVLVAPPRLDLPASADEGAPYSRWMLDRHGAGTVLASICAGAFLLAGTGLLEGRPATTHWYFEKAFRERFPRVRLDIDKLIVDDGDIITAGGITAWMELGLRLVDRLLGPTLMLETSRFMLVDPNGREQRNYSSFSPILTHGDAAIVKVQHWLQSAGHVRTAVPDMAAHAGLEPRTFLRRFHAATGMKPVEYLQALRVGKARERLEFTQDAVERIGWDVGYEDPAAFRKVFHKVTGLSPGDYRRRFGLRPSASAA